MSESESDFLFSCKKYFNTTDLYEVLNITKNATEKEVRKAYHKLSLSVHPDRVEESKKSEATEKFKVLGKVHSILSDKEKRKVYDDTGEFDETDLDWAEYWRCIFKEITEEDINNYEKRYKGSDEELMDLKKAYLNGKGDMDFILEAVPFTHTEEEPRLRELIDKMIKDGDVPSYRAYTHETPQKKAKRKRKWQKEAEEAERLKKSRELEENDLVLAIRKNREGRAQQMDSFFDRLAAKYGGSETKSRSRSSSGSKRGSTSKDSPQAAKKSSAQVNGKTGKKTTPQAKKKK